MVDQASQRLHSQQDRNPYSSSLGCWDRRFWAWKLVDFPEATFQCNVYPLTLLLKLKESFFYKSSTTLDTIKAGLLYACRIQHRNGSFDQAFPYEQSFGATALLLHSLLESYQRLGSELSRAEYTQITNCLKRAASFLCQATEKHGFISNHLAGASLALLEAGRHFDQIEFEVCSDRLLKRVLENQSAEGWFLEYSGADPGYQTLCVQYLAEINELKPSTALENSLSQAVEFTQWFVHPDGSFGGKYGSRRTSIFYPAGFALLSERYPLAKSIYSYMLQSILQGRTPTTDIVDMGNLSPLLSSYLRSLMVDLVHEENGYPELPHTWKQARHDFPEAGLHICGNPSYYAIVGGSNGGTLKVFDKINRCLREDDGGYVGKIGKSLVTTQKTLLGRKFHASDTTVSISTCFYSLVRQTPSPFLFLMLRFVNLTIARITPIGNWLKLRLARRLMGQRVSWPLILERQVKFEAEQLVVEDLLRNPQKLSLEWLEDGNPFSSIHMASAGYPEHFDNKAEISEPLSVDVNLLRQKGVAKIRKVI